jgi:hypothetical protein
MFRSQGSIRGQADLALIIREGVRAESFFRHFKGSFKGKEYNCLLPPSISFNNALSYKPFDKFVSETIIAWVASGVATFHGLKDNCAPPYLVLPLTVEPSKPRLCHDERYLNLCIKDMPFKLDHLPDLPRYVFPGHFQTSM